METLLNRYRNVTVLLLALFAQLILLAYQVKTNEDVRLIRLWAVSAVTPLARLLETGRARANSLIEDYFDLVGVRQENRRLLAELGRLKMENQYLRAELGTAERAEALAAFQARSPSKTVAARVIATGAGQGSRVVFVDRGSNSGVQKGMAVIKPNGIVGRVMAVYPASSQVLLVSDANFAAGVVSQKHRVVGTLKGTGSSYCIVDYLQNEERVEVGEWFYTSGDDRLYPRGLPVGPVTSAGNGKTFKQVHIMPSGLEGGLDEVLIVIEGLHQPIPESQQAATGIYMLPAPQEEQPQPDAATAGDRSYLLSTEADRLLDHYKRVGEAQGHVFGEGPTPDFNIKPGEPASAPAQPPGEGGSTEAARAAPAVLSGQPQAAGATPTRKNLPAQLPKHRPAATSAKPPADEPVR